jgi:hypothetical protein
LTPHEELYLDRLEEGYAVIISNGKEFSIPRGLMPSSAAGGDYLTFEIKVLPGKDTGAVDEISGIQERLQRPEE